MATVNSVLQDQQRIAVSTATKVLVDGNIIGVVQSLEPSQDRATTAVRGLGIGDRQLGRIWGLTEYKLSVNKFALFSKQMINMFGYGDAFRMLAQLRKPIDIQEIIMLPVADSSSEPLNFRTTVYRGCYMTSHSAPKNIGGDVVITESASFDVTYIDDGETEPFDYPVGFES